MKRFNILWERYLRDECSEGELQELLDLMADHADQLGAGMTKDLYDSRFRGMTSAAQRELMLSRVLEQVHETGHKGNGANGSEPLSNRFSIWRRLAAAAAILAVIAGAGVLVVLRVKRSGQEQITKADIQPGTDRAVLTLADGTTVDLAQAQNGQLVKQGETNVTKQKDGQLAYENDSVGPLRGYAGNEPMTYNTITTPKGGRYRVLLPDGSTVLLNAASSLRYPTAFRKDSRSVTLTGEAYFEIAPDQSSPFTVIADGMKVQVLGTHFDVMTYGDEAFINTTLAEGKVQVLTTGPGQPGIKVLKPGQEARLHRNAATLVVQPADLDKALAWTTGFFKFDHSDLPSIMREIARWYDVEIIYETTDNKQETYSGRIRRNLNLSVLIQFLESSGFHHFRIDGKKLIVLP